MTKIGIQLSQYHESLSPLPAIIEQVSEFGYTGIEFAYRIFECDVEEVASTLTRTGITPIGGHYVPTFHDLEEAIEVYQRVGCDRAVITHLAEPRFADEAKVRDTANYLGQIADQFREHGIDVAYHNDGLEDKLLDSERTALEAILEETDELDFELDIGHAQEIGTDPVRLLEEHGDRFYAVHIKDWTSNVGRSVELGSGEVDVYNSIQTALETDSEWLVYEGSRQMDDPDQVQRKISEISNSSSA